MSSHLKDDSKMNEAFTKLTGAENKSLNASVQSFYNQHCQIRFQKLIVEAFVIQEALVIDMDWKDLFGIGNYMYFIC